MFFSTYVLTKRGPLAKIWLAAHWDRRLTRNEVRVVDLRQSVVDIVQPAVPIALRTSGELLVGVVRIYALKVKHLLKDATDATLILRVAPLPAKAGVAPSGLSKNNKQESEGAGAMAMLDGVLISGNGDIEAVTFDWSGGAASGAVATGKTDAEALEARFDDIADLLYGTKQPRSTPGISNSGSRNNDASALLASAWYAVEPASQTMEELHSTQQDYDEIAKLRADLAAFGDRVSGSSSSKKSSNPSIEKARSSGVMGMTAATGLGGEFAGFPAPGEEMDIGVPLPEDHALFPDFMMPPQGGEDPLALPDMAQPQQEEPQAPLHATARKTRSVNVLDLAATTVSGETVQRWMDDRSDIVDTVPRRGPYDAQEARDRATLTPESSKHEVWALVDAAPLSWQPNPSLRAMYTTLLRPFVAQAEAAAVPPLHQQFQQQQQYDENVPAGGMEEEGVFAAALNEEEAMQARKRGRDDKNVNDTTSVTGGLSMAAMATLKRVRDELVLPVQYERPSKRARKELATREFCLLQSVCRGMRRREAARAFVSVLALASKQLVSVRQPALAGDVELGLLPAGEGLLLAS
ncbi:double-strand-break repair protein rad21 [Trypanosoma rangeli]|uniref:Double-strand-break repair protein rad21 n=1 Tax=Trypanosoma rangeli TaxID=5698 RepID=A0A422NBQ8_TRYRA|nr:double-strand-break repair protein rad21 [Trypanosoma rangeli]RNF02882.1 double-strand-break repair protein rad21 [Trypanosoma rangeli]|eukprot:RNF02882.1 double-strand-break repair protein rad21 [Trypanosoma rangeli]